MEKSNSKVKQLQDYVFANAPKNDFNISTEPRAVPILMADATLIAEMMKHIANTNRLLEGLNRKPTYLTLEETKKFFDISDNTLRSWRNRGLLAYSQYQRKVMFSFADIEAFLNNHRHEAFQYR